MNPPSKLIGVGRQHPNGTIMILAESQHPTDHGAPEAISLTDDDCKRLIAELQTAIDSPWPPTR